MQNELGHHPFIGGIILVVGLYFFIISLKAMFDEWFMGEESSMPDIVKSAAVVASFVLIIFGGGMISYVKPVIYVILGVIGLHSHYINKVFGDSTIIDFLLNTFLFVLFMLSLNGIRLLFAISRDHGPEYAGDTLGRMIFGPLILPVSFYLFNFTDDNHNYFGLNFYEAFVYIFIINILIFWSLIPPIVYSHPEKIENE